MEEATRVRVGLGRSTSRQSGRDPRGPRGSSSRCRRSLLPNRQLTHDSHLARSPPPFNPQPWSVASSSCCHRSACGQGRVVVFGVVVRFPLPSSRELAAGAYLFAVSNLSPPPPTFASRTPPSRRRMVSASPRRSLSARSGPRRALIVRPPPSSRSLFTHDDRGEDSQSMSWTLTITLIARYAALVLVFLLGGGRASLSLRLPSRLQPNA